MMRSHRLTAVFWNTWFDAQDGTHGDGTETLRRLADLITEHQPDVIGLNEVLASRDGHISETALLLERQGYDVHFSPVYEHSDHSITGNIFAAKVPVASVTHHHLERAIGREPRHQKYQQSHLIEAQIIVGDTPVTVFVAHLASIWPRQWATHRRQRRAYQTITRQASHADILIGGDFNETKYMLPWLKRSRYRVLTGGLRNPTWRWRGKRHLLLHGNLDRVLYTKDGHLRLRQFHVLDRAPSDHAPLLAEFSIE